jgi:hypothetical protein
LAHGVGRVDPAPPARTRCAGRRVEDAAIEEGTLSGVVGSRSDGLTRRVPADLDPVSPLLPPEARGTELPGACVTRRHHPTAPLLAAVYQSRPAVLPRSLGVVPPTALPAGAAEPVRRLVERAPELDGQPFLDSRV